MEFFSRTSSSIKAIRARSHGFAGMAGEPVVPDPRANPLNAAPPGSRDLRAQAVHRLQVGMFGLAAMLLLVSLASVIMDRVKTADRSIVAGGPSSSPSAESAGDPLVDLGVAPDVPVAGNAPARKPPQH